MTSKKTIHFDQAVDVSAIRRSAIGGTLQRDDLDADPFRQFDAWMRQAIAADVLDPNAMNLATVDEDHRPASRTVLLKYFDAGGFVFFTNLSSNKARQISTNNSVALSFFWPESGRQIAIRGHAERVSGSEALRYFLTRPRGSQIGAWVSEQSSVVDSRALLEEKFAEIRRKFSDREIPLPSFWGGFRVVPTMLEFWQGRRSRLHDRFRYTRQNGEGGDDWHIERLSP